MDKSLQYIKIISDIVDLSINNVVNKKWMHKKDAIPFFFNAIVNEINEAREEYGKENNQIFLEDELGDVFWDYLVLLKLLEEKGEIRSVDAIFKRVSKKFHERNIAIKDSKNDAEVREKWEACKKEQSKKLIERQDILSG